MTPQEKAKELIDKYNLIIYRGVVPLNTYVESIKKSALLAVDEIINIGGDGAYTNYWNQVKKEIKKEL